MWIRSWKSTGKTARSRTGSPSNDFYDLSAARRDTDARPVLSSNDSPTPILPQMTIVPDRQLLQKAYTVRTDE